MVLKNYLGLALSVRATISDSKSDFHKEFPYVIPPIYRKLADELLFGKLINGGTVKVIIENDKLSFCTCGQSKNKPFCDQTHQRVHNVVEGEEDVWDQMDDYERIQTLISIKKSHMDFRLKERKDPKFGDYARMKEIGKEITEEMLENESE